MATFAAPINPVGIPPILPNDEWSLSYKLFRHYKSRPEGINVFIYSDGSVSEVEPDGYSTLWSEENRMGDTLPSAPHCTHVFWGGHDADVVTDAEAVLLIAAGYVVL